MNDESGVAGISSLVLPSGTRWKLAGLLCAVTTINYLDRQAFAIAGPSIVDEFRLSNTEFGAITSAFLFCYGVGHLIVGPFIDRIGTRRAFNVAVIAWSMAGILHAFGRGFWSFLGFRALLGLFESANFPAAVKGIAEWFPRDERSMAVGILTVGPGLGALLAPPLLGALILYGGWQWAFIAPGLAGFGWLWFWRRLAPGSSSPVGEASPAGLGLKLLLRRREVWGLLLSRVLNDGAFYFFVAWLPLYLAQARGFDLLQIAAFAWIPFLASDAGALGGGWFGRHLLRRGWSLDRSRKSLIWGGALLVLASLPAGTSNSPAVALALIALAMFAIQAKASSLFALPADLFPAIRVGTVWGLFGAAGSFGAAAFSLAAGWISQHYAYEPIFWAVAITQLLSAVVISWLLPEIRRLDGAEA